MRTLFAPLVVIAMFVALAHAETPVVPFDAEHWVLDNARVVEQAGRQAVTGMAVLKDVRFQDGVIEVDVRAPDVRLTGGRAYPGVMFRMQSPGETERLYLRPHRAGLYADAVQYTPVFNGVAGWQLYNGDGFTSSVTFPLNEWVPVRIEVAGRRARVFVGNGASPSLEVHDLKHGVSQGAVALYAEGAAFFSNFRCTPGGAPQFPPAPPVDSMPGVLNDWDLSRGFRALMLDTERYPDAAMLSEAKWQKVNPEPSGLVDVARTVPFNGAEPECVLARTVLRSESAGSSKKIDFGYSDAVSMFLNGDLIFAGDSSYRLRDPSFLGIIGYWDTVNLPLRKGDNELLLEVCEGFGGWGFMCRDAGAVFTAPGVTKAWETGKILRMPESAVYDAARKVVYVSVFDGTAPSMGQGRQSLARLSLDGKSVEPSWLPGFDNPTGLAIRKDTLYVVERARLVEVDLVSGTVVRRYDVAAPGFLNDVAVDPSSGEAFISDSGKNTIYRFDGQGIEPWLSGDQIRQPNGLFVLGDKVIVGTSGDGCLKVVDRTTKAVTTLARLGAGIVDGIAVDESGAFLVSHNEGRLFRITPEGEVQKILDTSVVHQNLADFAYVAGARLVVAPTYTDGRVAAFELPRQAF